MRVYESRGYIYISVEDTGVGIAVSDLPRIFQAFYRGSGNAHSSDGGLGLGLNIVKELVQMQHGTIKVTSKVGMGTTFTICFPSFREVS